MKYFVLKERGRSTRLRRGNKLTRYRKARKLQTHLTLSQAYESRKTIAGKESLVKLSANWAENARDHYTNAGIMGTFW